MIEILNPKLDSKFADYWGEYLPYALENWRSIVEAGCYKPVWYQAPTNALQQMSAGDYNQFALQILPGSIILEVIHSFQEGVTGQFQVQVTDTAFGHQWFSQPTPDSFFYKRDGRNGYVLPKPYPVITPGNFLFERWCIATGICELLFVVAEPMEGIRGL